MESVAKGRKCQKNQKQWSQLDRFVGTMAEVEN
jgi:hypothetical protein